MKEFILQPGFKVGECVVVKTARDPERATVTSVDEFGRIFGWRARHGR